MNTPRLCIVPTRHPAAVSSALSPTLEQRIGEIAGQLAISDSLCLLDLLCRAVRLGVIEGYARRTQDDVTVARRLIYGQETPPEIADDPARTAGPGELPSDDERDPDDHHPDSREHQE